ncbi:hypothetical protein [Shewanella sedimentimangrovi]|uniref:Uncharacterized protein n=1 Tax=Shewanella sedimentimangrovi TaxID=2814293 RepID=A0ABX7R0G9_9GAMM|nr:hypothetical protein [Shewanella sedimentimangrovi]QSX36351.1 hypothetical protein JYB85_13725 [Shewanella sedimentimangrovi]
MTVNDKDPLDTLLEKLPRELAPERDLWPGISARLDKPQPHKGHSKGFLAAAATVLLALVLYGQWSGERRDEEQVALQTLIEGIALRHQQDVAAMQTGLWQTVGWQQALNDGLDELRRAAEEIRQALKQHPTDKQLWQLWLWTQRREIELLKQSQRLPRTGQPQGESI